MLAESILGVERRGLDIKKLHVLAVSLVSNSICVKDSRIAGFGSLSSRDQLSSRKSVAFFC